MTEISARKPKPTLPKQNDSKTNTVGRALVPSKDIDERDSQQQQQRILERPICSGNPLGARNKHVVTTTHYFIHP